MIDGHCLCGAVTIRVSSHGTTTAACHCRMCQRWTGGFFLEFVAPADAVTVTGAVATYASTTFASRAFCPVCGSHLWFRDQGEDTPYELMPGLFDAALDLPLDHESYADRAMPAPTLAGHHRRVTRAEYESQNRHLEGDMK